MTNFNFSEFFDAAINSGNVLYSESALTAIVVASTVTPHTKSVFIIVW